MKYNKQLLGTHRISNLVEEIDFSTQQELDALKTFHEPFCLTLYIPLDDSNGINNTTRINLKNVLKEAESALFSKDISVQAAKDTLQPAKLLFEDKQFWPIAHGSLALFLHPKLFRIYHVPGVAIPRLLGVETGFIVEPLESVVRDSQQYFILTLGHKNVHLYEGNHHRIDPVHLKYLPNNMQEALGIDEYPKSRETHTIAPASTGKGSEASHEQYNVSQTDKQMLLEFFRQIDHHLHKFLLYHQKPLVIAGVDYLLPIYRKVNTYPGLLKNSITGNQDHVDLHVLKDKAWNVVKNASA